MLTHPSHEMLTALGLTGMARAFAEMAQNPEARSRGAIAEVGG